MTARSLARYLRVILACVALALVCPVAATTASIDASAWIAETPRDQGEAPARPNVSSSPSALNDFEAAPRVTDAVRTTVVQSRIYIRHEALLC